MKKLGVPASGRVPAPFLRTLTVYGPFVTNKDAERRKICRQIRPNLMQKPTVYGIMKK